MTHLRLEGQKLAGTSLDSQGERLSLEDLQAYCEYCRGKKVPLHQQHQMGEPTTGFIENVRIVPDTSVAGEWSVIGDVTVLRGALDKGLRGFSISFVAPLVERDSAECLLYIPHPHYNNHALVSDLAADEQLKIGKWVKKCADPSSYALFGATIAFALTPAWDHIYKSHVAPVIDRFINDTFPRLQQEGLKLEHVQVVFHNGHDVELRFVPEPGKEQWCFSKDCLVSGIGKVASRLEHDPLANSHGVQRVVLRYDVSQRAYDLVRIEYRHGHIDEA